MKINTNVKKIFIHAGLTKTASTTIQNVLYKNNKLLQKNDIDFFYDLAIKLHYLFMESPNEYTLFNGLRKENIDDLIREKKAYLSSRILHCKNSTIILSDEVLSFLSESEISAFCFFLKELAPNATLKIILYVRDFQNYLTSLYQQEIKEGKQFDVIHTQLYRHIIEVFNNVFGKKQVMVLEFEKAIKHENGPAGHFIGVINEWIKLKSIKKDQSNISISCQAGEILTYINEVDPLYTLKKNNIIRAENVSHHRYKKDILSVRSIRGDKFRLPSFSRQMLFQEYREDIEWLRQEYGIDYTLQNNPIEPHRTIYDQVYYDDVIRAFSAMSDYIRFLVYCFLKQKTKEMLDENSLETIERLCKWVECNYSELISNPNIKEKAVKDAAVMKAYARVKSEVNKNKRMFCIQVFDFLRYFRSIYRIFDVDYYMKVYRFGSENSGLKTRAHHTLLYLLVSNTSLFRKIFNNNLVQYYFISCYYGFNPNADIDITQYISRHPTIVTNRENVLIHYIRNQKKV